MHQSSFISTKDSSFLSTARTMPNPHFTPHSNPSIISSHTHSSHYAIPNSNYPPQEPVFIIPNVPEITKVPEPRPLKKAPPPGYDMRTLRKQLDFLYAEIDERTETQSLLYRQNEELWNYTQTLLEANKLNIATMRQQVTNLHQELRDLHQERKLLTDKLQLSQNSGELLRKLNEDIGSLQSAGQNAETLRREAEMQLNRAKEERQRLEMELHAQEEELQQKHSQLDELRGDRQEQETLLVADRFFHTNPTILRSAYNRFKTSVVANMRLTRIHERLSSLYKRHLKSIHWRLWKRYLYRRHIMHENTHSRNVECRDLCFYRWRNYAIYERLCYANQRQRVLKTYFNQWSQYSREEHWNRKADFRVNYFQNVQFKKKFFRAWKNSVTFLEWNSERTVRLELKAIKHYMRGLLQAWANVTLRDMQRDFRLSLSIRHVVLSGWWMKWRKECLSLWKRRARLSLQFFVRCKAMVKNSLWHQNEMVRAAKLWIGLNKTLSMRRWTVFTRSRRHLRRGRSSITRLALHRNRKIMRTAILTLARRTLISLRLKIRMKSAVAHDWAISLRRSLLRWHRHASNQVTARMQAHRNVLQSVWATWTRVVAEQKRDAILALRANRSYACKQRACLRRVLQAWSLGVLQVKRCRINAAFIENKHKDCLERRCFVAWRSQWTRSLLWQLRERDLEVERVCALNDLKLREIDDLERRNEAAKTNVYELEETLVSLQEVLASKEMELAERNSTLVSLREDKDRELEALARTREKLGTVIEERDRLRVIEQMVLTNRRKEDEEMRRRKEESQRIMAALQADSEKLRDEVGQARMQSYLADQQAAASLSREEQLLDETVQAAQAMELLVQQRKQHVHSLEADKELLAVQLQSVQAKIDEIGKEGHELLNDGASRIRSMTAENRVLSSSTGLAEARVRELRQLVGEARQTLGEMTIAEITQDEKRELDELTQMSSIADDALRRSYARNVVRAADHDEASNNNFPHNFSANTSLIQPSSATLVHDDDVVRDPMFVDILARSLSGPAMSASSEMDVVEAMKIQSLAQSIRNTLISSLGTEGAGSRRKPSKVAGSSLATEVEVDALSSDDDDNDDETYKFSTQKPVPAGSKSLSSRITKPGIFSNDGDDDDWSSSDSDSGNPAIGKSFGSQIRSAASILPTPPPSSAIGELKSSGVRTNSAEVQSQSNIYVPRSGLTSPVSSTIGGYSNPSHGRLASGATSSRPGSATKGNQRTHSDSDGAGSSAEMKSESSSRRFTSYLSSGVGLPRQIAPVVGTARDQISSTVSTRGNGPSSRPTSARTTAPVTPTQTSSGRVLSRRGLNEGASPSPGSSSSGSGHMSSPDDARHSVGTGRPVKGPVGQRYERARLSLLSLHDRLANKQPL